VLEGRPITIFGDGQQTRSFCFVSDLVEGLFKAARVDKFDSPVNLGNPGEVTMYALAEEVMRVAGRRVELVRQPLPADDPKRRCPDISKAQRLLGFKPIVPLSEGLAATYANFQARHDARGGARLSGSGAT
jgi:UDP-glucuronate decarboxylase